MPVAMTEWMRCELNENGFLVLESFIQGAELARISGAARGLAENGDDGAVRGTPGWRVAALSHAGSHGGWGRATNWVHGMGCVRVRRSETHRHHA